MIDENTWGMILGRSGKLLGPLGDEIQAMVIQQKREFYGGKPQDLYPDVLDDFRARMKEKGWETGQDDEELFEYAMHPEQYEDFMSGKAKDKFEKDLAKRKADANGGTPASVAAVPMVNSAGQNLQPRSLVVDVNGEKFNVNIAYPNSDTSNNIQASTPANTAASVDQSGPGNYVTSPLEGKFFLTKTSGEKGIQVGDTVSKGDTVAYVESMKVINAITTSFAGTVSEILVNHGDDIEEDIPIIKIV